MSFVVFLRSWIKVLEEAPRLLVFPALLCGSWQNTGPKKKNVRRRNLTRFCFPVLRSFLFSVFPGPLRRWNSPPASSLSSSGTSPLWSMPGNSVGSPQWQRWRTRPSSTCSDTGLLPSPRRPPRHHWTYVERRGLPVSGKCPGPSRNQPVTRGSPLPTGGECGKPAGRMYGKPNGR